MHLFHYGIHLQHNGDNPLLLQTTSNGTVGWYVYVGDPNGNVTANQGSICSDTTPTARLWFKETGTGNTGWIELTNQSGGGGPISAIYSEVANKAARPAFAFDGQLVRCDSNLVTYIEFENAWQIFSMHLTGGNDAFEALDDPGNVAELEVGQQFTNEEMNFLTLAYSGATNGWIEERPKSGDQG